eukprot:scaffold66021_cov17-Tisochrysis_lutea.AAC.1
MKEPDAAYSTGCTLAARDEPALRSCAQSDCVWLAMCPGCGETLASLLVREAFLNARGILASGDAQAVDKIREAYNSPPAQLGIILNDAISTEALHQEAQRQSHDLHQQSECPARSYAPDYLTTDARAGTHRAKRGPPLLNGHVYYHVWEAREDTEARRLPRMM